MAFRKPVQRFALVLLVLSLATGIAAWQDDPLTHRIDRADTLSRSDSDIFLLNAVSFLPAYDSGWFVIGARPDPTFVTFDHQLGGDPDDYVVTLMCKDDTLLATYDCVDQQFLANANWHLLTSTSVRVWVPNIPRPDEVRVRIFLVDPDYDSGWNVIGARPDPMPLTLDHMLFGDPNDYLVRLECKDDTALDTYSCTDFGFSVNAGWYDLTNTSINVWVRSSPLPDEVRARIFLIDPDYDSGWNAIGSRPDPIPVAFDHRLGGDPGSYLVSLECRDDRSLLNTYQCTDLSFNINAHWYDLDETSVRVWVRGGTSPDEIRVRIWRVENFIFADGFESGDTSAWSGSVP